VAATAEVPARRALLDAALDVFAERGYTNASVRHPGAPVETRQVTGASHRRASTGIFRALFGYWGVRVR
jgi:hypothetical protein